MTPSERLEACHWQHWWLPPGVDVIDRPELCYTTSTRIPRLNLVFRVDAPPSAIPALVGEFERAHRATPSICWQNDHRGGEPLARALRDAGYDDRRAYGDARILTIADHTPRACTAFSVEAIETVEDARLITQIGNDARGTNNRYSDEDYRQILSLTRRSGARQCSYLVRDATTDEPVSYGNLKLYPSHRMAVLEGGCTAHAHRGRGAYTASVEARIAVARAAGFKWMGLYANAETSSPIVAKLGFELHGGRQMWVRDPVD